MAEAAEEAEATEEDESAEATEEVTAAEEAEAEAPPPTPSDAHQFHRHQAVLSPWHSPAGCRA